jgi:hypothetical protein
MINEVLLGGQCLQFQNNSEKPLSCLGNYVSFHTQAIFLHVDLYCDGSLVYSVVTELPAIYILYDSSFWSAVFLLSMFSVSVWNGGGFYIEVFGRKYVALNLQF